LCRMGCTINYDRNAGAGKWKFDLGQPRKWVPQPSRGLCGRLGNLISYLL
jgi:hypothetical protein